MSDSDDDVPIAALKSKKPTAKKSVAASDEQPSKVTKAPAKKPKKEPDAEGDDVKVKKEKAERPAEWEVWQKAPTPGEDDAGRKFYTSLLKQIPTSEMAKKWCLRHGVLPVAEAKKIWLELEKKGGKSPAAAKTKSRLVVAEDDEEDVEPKAKKAAPRSTGSKSKRSKKEDEDEDEDDEDEPIVKKLKKEKPVPKLKESKPAPKKKSVSKDVAFDDGGMGDDDDDDKPLLAMAKAKKSSIAVKKEDPAPAPAPAPFTIQIPAPEPSKVASSRDDDSDDLPLIKRSKN